MGECLSDECVWTAPECCLYVAWEGFDVGVLSDCSRRTGGPVSVSGYQWRMTSVLKLDVDDEERTGHGLIGTFLLFQDDLFRMATMILSVLLFIFSLLSQTKAFRVRTADLPFILNSDFLSLLFSM